MLVSLFAMWAVAFPVGPVATVLEPDLIVSLLSLGVFALPIFWVASAVGVLALGTYLHRTVRAFRRAWILIPVMASGLAVLSFGWLWDQASGDGWLEPLLVHTGAFAAAGTAVGLLVAFCASLMGYARSRQGAADTSGPDPRVQDRGDARTDPS
ncbi:hypothetical protein [Microbacterium sp. G2-8]|uniref:hypothetical protein n=1 Tax=Microbacterium sp. G2-8 TaxID=2842454 RepID=UPI001C897D0D|nr:hypothetical protein [Microbacterium sp. G2-8]